MSARTDHVLIVGTGFAGIGMGIRLKQAGFHDFTILEQADGVGGTWRDNHYPGAACDVPSHLYSFSFEPNPRWSRSYALQSEILAYLEHCTDKYGLRPHLRLKTGVTRATFDERAGVWNVEATDGVARRARALVSGCGGLSKPSLPDIAGLATFDGKTFHSARWDHDVSLAGKRVGVIGTGASAIQIVPEIVDEVQSLHVFQRTPPWILPKPDRAITKAERGMFRRAPALQMLARTGLYWQHELRALAFVVEPKILEKRAEPEALRYLRARVKSPELRAKLTPKYRMGCKRVLMSNDYFEALQKPHAEVVTDPIVEVRSGGILTGDGKERGLDAIVLATGFHAADAAAPFEVRGRNGRSLDEEWKGGAEAYLGTTVAGFPNLFLLVGPNTGLGHNSMVFMIEAQVQYTLDCIRTMKEERLKFVDVRPGAQSAFNAEVQAKMARTVWSTGGCTSWYTTKDGKNTTLWPGFTVSFRMRTRRFDPAPYELVREDEGDSIARGTHARGASEEHASATGE